MIFRFDLKIFLFLILYFFTKQLNIYLIIMSFVISHEISHILAGIALKMKPKKLELMPIGLAVEFKIDVNDYNKKFGKSNFLNLKKLIVAIAGPLFNVIAIFVIKNLNINGETKQIMVYSNLLIAIFNLIPIYPLDGGRILKYILNLFIKRKSVNKYIYIISNISLFIIISAFSILVYYCRNFALIIILIYLIYTVYKENKKYRMLSKFYRLIR